MAWWAYLIAVIVIVLVAAGFASLVGFQTRLFSSRTDRRAEDLYPGYDDGKHRRRHRS